MTTYIFLIFVTLFGSVSFASAEIKRLTTSRGAVLEVTVHAAAAVNSPTIVIAPGVSCNSKGPLFEAVGNKGSLAGFTVVRFEWAYCLIDPTKPNPSPDLKNELEDYFTVLNYAKTLPSVDASKILLAGKSLGSIVAYTVFQSTESVKALILLTPVCSYITDDNGNPLEKPMQVCEENYPGLKKDIRPVMMAMGDKDDRCILNILFDYLKDSSGNIEVTVAGGDHGFRIKKSDDTVDDLRTMRNIDSVVTGVLNWADLKINP
jgi:predicted alpha/beta-hydrolase family hydrolase